MRIAGFEFKEGARFQSGASADAKEVGAHLELLRKECKGELTPEDVLRDAKNPNSPLHSYFEWSDSAAAHEYRLQQARGLIRSVVAIYVRDDQPAIRTKAYVHIPEPGAHHYREASHAMSQKRTREMVLQQALRELMNWRRRYAELKEFAGLVDTIDRVAEEAMKSLPKR